MKTRNLNANIKIMGYVVAAVLLIGTACNNDDNQVNPQGPDEITTQGGISAEELEQNQGEIGIIVDTRELAKKGYTPSHAKISTDASSGDYDQEIEIDEFTNIASLSIPVESLSETAEAELRDGLNLSVEILDQNGKTIISQDYSKTSFVENGNKLDINVEQIPEVHKEIEFAKDMPHFLQLVDANGKYSDQVVEKPANAGSKNTLLHQDYSTFRDSWTNHQYYFQRHPNNNTFSIYSRHTKRYLAVDDNDQTFRQSGAYSFPMDPSEIHPRYKFIIRKEENGLYTINDINGRPLRRFSVHGLNLWTTRGSGDIQYFRIIALNIEWDIQELDTRHMTPIFPAVETSFGFNSTLVNCGTGALQQEVGIQKTIITTYTTGFEETIGLSGRVTSTTSATVGAEAEASFFGNGGKVSSEVSTSLEVSVEASKSTTKSSEFTKTSEETYFSNRIVTVPAGMASLVYDAYQTYSNVRIPFVKRFRVKGKNENTGSALTGEQITSQFSFVGFSGVVTEIGPDFIEISIKGTTVLDNIVDTKSEVLDVASNCGN